MAYEHRIKWRVRPIRWAVILATTVFLLIGSTATAFGAGNDWVKYVFDLGGGGFNNETAITLANADSLQAVPGWPISLFIQNPPCPPPVPPNPAPYCGSNTIAAQPIVATVGGQTRIFIGSWNGYEYGLDASGRVIWQTYVGRTSGDCEAVLGVSSTAAIATVNGTPTLYVGGGGDVDQSGAILPNPQATLYALNAATGAVIWQTTTQLAASAPSAYLWSSPVVYGGSVFIGVASKSDCPLVAGKMAKLDTATGALQSTFTTVPTGPDICVGATIWGSPTIDAAQGTIYFTTGNPGWCHAFPGEPGYIDEPYSTAIVELKLSDLSPVGKWQVTPPPTGDLDFGSVPMLFTGTVTGGVQQPLVGVANKNGTYYVFARDHLDLGPVSTLTIATGGDQPKVGDGSISPSAADGSKIYVAGGNTTINGTAYQGSVRAFDANALPVSWQDAVPAMPGALWQVGFNGPPGGINTPVLAPVSAVPGIVIVTAGPNASLIDSATGSLLKTLPTSNAFANTFFAGATVSHGVLYLADTAGFVYAYAVGAAPAAVGTLSPTSLAFGDTPKGQTSPAKTITIKNTGNAPMTITQVAASGDFAAANCVQTLQPGGSCDISVTFTPTGTGTRSGTLTVTDDAANNPQTASLTGKGTTPGAPSGWQQLGGGFTSSLDASSWGPGRLDVFGRGLDGALWHRWNDGSWHPWESLGGIIVGGPSAVSAASGRIDVFARGSDNQLWHKAFGAGGWSGWQPLGGSLTSGPDVAASSASGLDVFVRGADAQLWEKSWDGVSWGGWYPLGGLMIGAPGAVSRAANQLDIFVRGVDNQLWQKSWNGTSWGGWAPLGGILTSGPDAASLNGHLDVVGRGSDGQVWRRGWNGTTWAGWQPLGGGIIDKPSVVGQGSSIDVVVRGLDNAAWLQVVNPT